ncbi:MAG TPA: hypothetical protein DCW90_17890 [Lachnospiraceae bacterium]|nr:hypothetical protein [Lachnospiraceae bacterium]
MKEYIGEFKGYGPKSKKADLYQELGLLKGETYKVMFDKNLPHGGCRVYVWRDGMFHSIDYSHDNAYQDWKFIEK